MIKVHFIDWRMWRVYFLWVRFLFDYVPALVAWRPAFYTLEIGKRLSMRGMSNLVASTILTIRVYNTRGAFRLHWGRRWFSAGGFEMFICFWRFRIAYYNWSKTQC